MDLISFLPRAVMQGIPLLYGSTGEILTEKSGNLNLGIPGIMYVGGICGVIGAFFYEQSTPAASMNGLLAVGIPMLCSLLGSLLMGLLYCLLTVTLRANQNVTGLAMTTFGVGIGNFFGGSLIELTGSEVPSIALSTTSAYQDAARMQDVCGRCVGISRRLADPRNEVTWQASIKHKTNATDAWLAGYA